MKLLKCLLLTIILGLFTISVSWAAFLVCDPSTQATHYLVSITGKTATIVPAQADGSLKFDLSTLPVPIIGNVAAGREWVLNGVPQGTMEWSTPVTFNVTGGTVTGGCANMKIKK
jgi:hypothetical protein